VSHARSVAITGCGLVTPLGDEPRALFAALDEGRCGVGAVDLFDPGPLRVQRAAQLIGFAPDKLLAKNNWRALDRTGHLATVATQRALADAGWAGESGDEDGAGRGLVLGTMFGSLRTISEFDRRALTAGPMYAKPMDFANSVLNAAAGQAAIWHGLDGVNATVSGGPAAGAAALAYAGDLLRCGRARQLLAGGAEELAFESCLGFERAGWLTEAAAVRPFDRSRDGFLLGEGAALLALEDSATAARRGARVRGFLRGWAATFDPSRGRDGSRASRAAERSMRLALEDAGLPPSAIGVCAASANGSPAADRAEAIAVRAVLGASVPVLVCKAALGESLGAGAAAAAVALLVALEAGVVPGTRGFEIGDEGLEIAVSADRQSVRLPVGLLHASSLDGQHVALVLALAEGA
jgi:3-oxoacyl-[acyl-carrier-protein] synthase II